MCIHGSLKQEERTARFEKFRNFQARVLVATDLVGRGIDVMKVNIVINYDTPLDQKKGDPTTDAIIQASCDSYLHRVRSLSLSLSLLVS